MRPPRSPLVVVWGAATAALVVFVLNLFSAALSCSGDTSYCAVGGEPREWRGLVLTAEGRPVAGARVSYGFESNRPRGRGVEVISDAQGRYCLRWPEETSTTQVAVASEDGAAALIVSPDAAGTSSTPIAAEPPLRVSSTPWDPIRDEAVECSESSAPWYRVDDLQDNWRYELVKWISLITLATGLAVALLPARARPRASLVPAVLAGIDVLMFVLFWVLDAV